MVKSGKISIVGKFILKIALGALFLVNGIFAIQGGTGDEAVTTIRYLAGGHMASALCIAFGIIELLAGVILLFKLFVKSDSILDGILMLIIMVVWILTIILVDIIGRNGLLNGFGGNLLLYLKMVAGHLLILGAIFVVGN